MCATLDVVDELSLRAEAEEVRHASDWLAGCGRAHGLPAEQMGRLELSLNEVFANILAHGGPGATVAPVILRLEIQGDAVAGSASLTVSDAGVPFNPLALDPGTRPQTLEEAEPGGLGLIMLRRFSERLAYHYDAGRNHLSFSVAWPSVPAP
jgi:serine/threonine-protein kinase RsbW